MKKLLLFLILVPSLVSSQNASELMARWDVSLTWGGFVPNVSYYNNAGGNVAATNITGSNISMNTGDDGFTGTNWPTSSSNPDYNKYFQFTVSPAQGKTLQPKHFRLQQTGGCRRYQVRYSTNPSFPGNGTLLYQSTTASTTQNQYITMPFPNNVTIASGQTLYIRVYGYYRQSSASSWRINSYWNFDWLNPTVDAPEFYGIATSTITANPDTASTYQGQPVNINVTANDVVTSTTISSIAIEAQSANGVATVQPNNTITFTPSVGYTGVTSFQYKATAANGGTSITTVTVTVLPVIPPIAVADAAAIVENATTQIEVLNNEIPGSGSITSVAVTVFPLHGSVYVENFIIYYTPNLYYIGPDSFTYTITDSFNNTSSAIVSLGVAEPVLPAPGSNNGVYCSSSTTWNGTQWSNGFPSTSIDAIFTGDYTQNGGTLNACSIFVTGNAQILFKNESNAVVRHSVNVAETASLTFESSCNLIQTENMPNEGNITIKRKGSKLKRLDYTFWSSPVTGQALQEFSPATLPDRFYTYNTQNSNFVSVASPSTATFYNARSYLIRMPNSITGSHAENYAAGNYRFCFEGVFTGVPNNGNISIPIHYYNAGSRFNGVGNPYPSPVSVTEFINANIDNIEGTLWIWRKTNNPNNTSYCTLTKFGYVGNNAPGGGGAGGNDGNDMIADPFSILPEGVLNTGQGFIIKAKNNADVVFRNSMRRQNNYANFFRNADTIQASPSTIAEASRFWLNVTNEAEDVFAQTLIGYTQEATLDYDNGLDGHFLSGGAANVYSISNGINLTIQARHQFDENDIVQLGFKAQSAGEYIFKLDHTDGLFTGGQSIYIHDKLLGVLHNIQENEYYFTSEAGTFEGRFEIVYSPEALSTMPVPVPDDKSLVVYSNLGKVGVKSTDTITDITIYDLLGKQLFAETGIDTNNYLTPLVTHTGQAVIIKLRLRNGVYCTRKLLVP